MKPSEYIARGVKLRKYQSFRSYTRSYGEAGCVTTALIDGIFGKRSMISVFTDVKLKSVIFGKLPELENRSFKCPKCSIFDISGCGILGVLFHLNDDHKWRREEIGEWLDLQVSETGRLSETIEVKFNLVKEEV